MSNRLLYIVLLWCSVQSYAQVNIELLTNKREYTTKDLIELTVTLEINGADMVQETPIRLPDFSQFYERGSGSSKNSVFDPVTNTAISQMVYQIILQPKNSGNLKIGSALVKVNGKVYKTEPFEISVADIKSPERAVNRLPSAEVYLNMEVEDREVYPFQPVKAVLKAYSRDFNSLRKFKNIIQPRQKNVEFFPVSFSRSDIELDRYSQVASQTVAVYLLFPEEAGLIMIDPIMASMETERIKSNGADLRVKRLPSESPLSFKNAVGEFKIEITSPQKEQNIEVGKPINITVKLKGEGNLTKKLLPVIKETEQYKVFPPKIRQNIKTTSESVSGSIEADYVVVPTQAGRIEVHTSEFSYFSPEKERYIDLGAKTISYNILTEQQVNEQKTALDKVNDYTDKIIDNVNIPILKTDKKEIEKTFLDALWDNLAFIISSFGILAVALIFLRKGKSKPQPPAEKEENISDIEKKLRDEQLADPAFTLDDLDRLIKDENYTAYLENVEPLLSDLDKKYQKGGYTDLALYISEQKNEFFKDYQELLQRIQHEKYRPIPLKDNILEIHIRLKSILNHIS